LRKKYNVKLYGPGWTAKDDFLRTTAYAARKIGLTGLNDRLSKLRITVPPQEENQLYSSAKICINLHEARTGAGKNRVILNERTFKIPACGGFEICDFVTPEDVLRRYFKEDEMVYAKDAEDWFRKIDHYMNHDDERERIRKKGSERALRDHLYTNRVRVILKKLGY
jgi:spore maturation protein CgeB